MAKKKPTRKIIEYALPKLRIDADRVVLSADPGSRNFGIGLVGIKNERIKVYANAVMMYPLNDLVSFNQAAGPFSKELKEWMSFKPNGMIAERFQTRGNSGPLIEQVGAMIGIMKGQYPKVPFKLTIASTWKNRLQKRFGVDLKDIYPRVSVQPHQLDAVLIGVYGLEQGLSKEIDYDLDNIIQQVEDTSLIGHIKGRK